MKGLPRSFRLSRESEKIIAKIAHDYRVSKTDIVEMILAGKIDVPKVLEELKQEEMKGDRDG